jgi:methionyl-tRNA formyltransferase
MRIVFMGTPAFSVPSLEALLEAGYEGVAVVAQPDRPRGRGLAPAAPPVAEAARRAGLRLLQPARVREPAFLAGLESLAPDLVAVAAFGQILPRALLDVPPRGCVNVHASLLPKYRGAAPIQWAILRGETVTGITTMAMNEKMDEGDMLLVREVSILPDENAGALSARLSEVGAALLVETVAGIAAGRITPRPQAHAKATLAPRLRKEDGRIPWAHPAGAVVNRVRAMTPWPGAFTTLGGRDLKIWEARRGGAAGEAGPGTVIGADAAGVAVAAGDGQAVVLRKLQLAGKKRLAAQEFLRGARLSPGTVLGGG